MTTRISQLDNISTVQGNVLVPLVSNITGNLTTVKGSVDTLKAFIVAATEANIVTANIGIKGYVDSVTTAWTANAGQQLSDLGNLYANASSQQSTLNSLLANAGSQSDLIIGINANVAAANLGIIGFIGLGNTIQSNQISAANLGMKGYVDSVASQSIYGNANVSSLITTNGLTNYSNVNAKAYAESMGYQNFGNVNVAALITTNGLTNYSNVNVSALITTNGLTNYSNVNVKAYSESMGYQNFGNVNVAAYVTTANSAVIGYVDNKVSTANIGVIGYIDLANTIQSNQISAANLGIKGYVDNQITTITGGAPAILDTLGELANALGADANLSVTLTSYIANVNANITTANLGMKGYVDSQSFYSNAKVATYLQYDSISNISVAGNVTASYFLGNGALLTGITASSSYSNVQVATYLPTYSGNIANITLSPSGVLTFSDGTTMITAASGGGSNYSNVNVTAYAESMGYQNYGNVNVSALITTNGLTNYSNVNASALITTNGLTNYSNVNVTAYTQTMGYTNYSNVNVAAYLTTGPIGTTGIIYANSGTQSTSVGTGALVVTGGAGISGNLTVGNLIVLGTQTTVNATSVNLSNSFVFLSNNNITNAVDIGFVGQYNAGQGNVFTGLVYRAADGVYRLFSNVSPQPSLTVNLASAVYSSLQVGGLNAIGNVLSTGLSVFGNTAHGLAGAVSGQWHTFVGNLTQTSSGGAVYINTTGNILSTGLSVFGNTRIGSLATPGALHTIIGNVDVSGAGTEYFNIGGNILAVNATFGNLTMNGNVDATGAWILAGSINSRGNVSIGGNTLLAGNTTHGTVGAGSGAFHTFVGNITQVTSGGANVYFNTTGNISASFGNFGSGNVAGVAIGYRDVPQITAANVTLIASDAGKHYYGSNTNPVTLTIPLNSSVAFGNGTAISLVNQGTGNITITPTAGVLLYLAGNTTAGSRTLTTYGMATLLKVQVNTWFINGTGAV